MRQGENWFDWVSLEFMSGNSNITRQYLIKISEIVAVEKPTYDLRFKTEDYIVALACGAKYTVNLPTYETFISDYLFKPEEKPPEEINETNKH